MEKFKQGLDVRAYYAAIKREWATFIFACQIIAAGCVLAIGGGVLGFWQKWASATEQAVHTAYPQLAATFHINPIQLSNQLVFFFAWASVIVVMKKVFTGRSKAAARSGWYYLGRMLLIMLWMALVGLVMGMAGGFAFVMGRQAMIAHTLGGAVMMRTTGAALASFASMGVFFLAMHMMLVGITFAVVPVLMGKGLRDAYNRGSRLLALHWPFALSFYVFWCGLAGVVQHIALRALPAGSVLSFVLSSCVYFTWPAFWLIFLPYCKRLVRSR